MNLHKDGFLFLTGMMIAVLPAIQIRAATTRDDKPDSAYVALGADPNYAAVGQFENSWGYHGSATLITPDWVLTAGHNLTASGSGTFTLGGIAYSSSQVFMNPGWNGDEFNGYDFGLVHLSTPVLSVTPVMFYSGSSASNQVATYVGYGFKGTGLTGFQFPDGQKRAFQNMIDGAFGTNEDRVWGSDFDNPHQVEPYGWGDSTPLELEGCVSPGDSGGGVFITENGHTYLLGVISFTADTDGTFNSDYGDYSGFGRISAVMPWILSTIPEPSSASLLVTGGIAWIVSRRARQHRR